MTSINDQGRRITQIADQIRAAVVGGGWTRERSAIASCRVGERVFRNMGHRVESIPVAPSILSERSAATDGREGHSIGVPGTGAFDTDTRSWDGHLVLIVDGRWLVDVSADQFSRPAMGITIEHPVIMHLGPGGTAHLTDGRRTTATRPDGVVISYQQMTTPGDWQRATDWIGKPEQVAAAVDTATKRLRTTLDVISAAEVAGKACGVCREPLDTVDGLIDGTRTYQHTHQWKDYDHEAVPVTIASIGGLPGLTGALCDFCCDPDPRWAYHGRNITNGSKPTPGGQGENWLGERWAGCDLCDRFVRVGDVEGLIRSACRSKANRSTYERLPPDGKAHIEDQFRKLWTRYLPTIHTRRLIKPDPPATLTARLMPKIRDRLVRLIDERGPAAFGDNVFRLDGGRDLLLPGIDVVGDGEPMTVEHPDGGPVDPPFYSMRHITDDAAQRFANRQRRSLGDAELYYVSEQFTALARAAGADLPDFTLTPEELPCPDGMILWQTPVHEVPSTEAELAYRPPAAVVGCSWSTVPGGVWIVLYAQPEQHMTEVDRAVLRESIGYLMPLAPGGGLQFGTTAAGGKADELMRVILSTWFLIMQPGVANVDEQQVGDPKTKRRLARMSPPRRLPTVRVVDLRRNAKRATGEPETQQGGWKVQVRFMVRGHWRRQAWGPRRALRRTIYVAPFIKGPDDAPLKTGEAPVVKVLK